VKVSELARTVGIAPSAIRFYEAKGILPSPPRNAAGYREYGETDVCRLRVLTALRGLGVDLHEAGRMAEQCGDGRCDDMAADLLPRLAIRRAEVARRRTELDHLDAELERLERAIREGEQDVLGINGSMKEDCCASDDHD
jgi:DNA-binding transcriptional MerR regulator